MSIRDLSWLPPLDENGSGDSFESYVDRIYATFVRDLIATTATFMGRRIAIPKHVEANGKHQKFWHVVTEKKQGGGNAEEDREFQFLRAERVGWIAPLLKDAVSQRALVWKDDTRGELRWTVTTADFSYVIVLADRTKFLHLVTAFDVSHERRQAKFQNDWKKFGVLC